MPNHVTNIINAPKYVLDSMIGEPGDGGERLSFDFNNVIPRPPELDVTAEGRATSLAKLLTGSVKFNTSEAKDGDLGGLTAAMETSGALQLLQEGGIKTFPDAKSFENFIQILRNCRNHGFPTWYEWDIANWGTKWNAYSCSRESDTMVSFRTAWAAPHPVISKLAEKFPNEEIVHRWADEDIGVNCGSLLYRDGEVTDHEISDPVDFALMLWKGARESYRENPETGKWEYYDACEGGSA